MHFVRVPRVVRVPRGHARAHVPIRFYGSENAVITPPALTAMYCLPPLPP